MIEVRLVRRQEHDRVALRQRLDRLQLCPIVVERLAVAAGVEKPDEMRGEVDDVRAVPRRDLAQILRRLARDGGFGAAEVACEPRNAAAKRRTREDVLVYEARHLVARTAQATLGALARQYRLPDDELGEARRLRGVHAASARADPRSGRARRRRCGSAPGIAAEPSAGGAAPGRADRRG